MNPAPMQTLLAELDRELKRESPNREPKGARVPELLGRISDQPEDWRSFALFDEATYARNLVKHCSLYELLVICWNRGQQSPIHNHQGSRCWMAVLEGTIDETLFRMPEGGGPLVRGASKSFEQGQVAFITDDIGLHEIRSSKGRPAVSLHLYAPPIPRCQIYDRETGTVLMRELSYHSISGVPAARAGQAK
jgi:cysteine dioxygenase